MQVARWRALSGRSWNGGRSFPACDPESRCRYRYRHRRRRPGRGRPKSRSLGSCVQQWQCAWRFSGGFGLYSTCSFSGEFIPALRICVIFEHILLTPRSNPVKRGRFQRTCSMARSDYLFTSESVSEGHPDKVADRISDEVVDLFFREGPGEGMSPWDIRAACETLCTTNRVVIAGETRGPKKVGAKEVEDAARPPSRISATSRTAFIGRTPRSKFCCTPSRRISPRAWTPAATRMKARATRPSCSVMPAAKPRR